MPDFELVLLDVGVLKCFFNVIIYFSCFALCFIPHVFCKALCNFVWMSAEINLYYSYILPLFILPTCVVSY